jgi:putative ABC transport system permease protein
MAAYAEASPLMSGMGAPRRVHAVAASVNLFRLLGVRPVEGRRFLPGESRPGALAGGDPVLLSDAFARAQFGSAAAALGRTFDLDARPAVVVGVMPAGFQFPLDAHQVLWTTMAPLEGRTSGSPLMQERGAHFASVILRLAPGETPAAAQARLAATAAAMAQAHPNNDAHRRALLIPMLQVYAGGSRPVLLLLLAATGGVLLIACLNVAGLQLARGARRRPEFALRFALGASRGAVLRQLACAGGLLGLLGALAGLALALGTITVLIRLGPANLVRLSQARLSWPVLLFTAAAALLAVLLFAVLPAASLAGGEAPRRLSLALAAGGRAGAGAPRWQRGLLVAQFGLTLTVLFVAGVLLHSLVRMARAPLGFAPARTLTAGVSIPRQRYPTPDDRARFFAGLIAGLRASPAVARAAGVYPLPLGGDSIGVSFDLQSHPLPEARRPDERFAVITPGYFRALGLPLLAGRDFNRRDTHVAAQFAIVNRAFARRYFGSRNPLGQRIIPDFSAYPGPTPPRAIIGVVGDTRQTGAAAADPPMFYLPEAQVPLDNMAVVVRPRPGAERQAGAAIAAVVRRLDANIPVDHLRPVQAVVNAVLAPAGFDALLLGLFAGVALLLAAVGLYAAMAQSVELRRREIGIGVAVGAARGEVAGMVVRDGLRVAAAGAALGTALALGLSPVLRAALGGVLFNVSSRDPLALAARSGCCC